uniref:Uncharacterized protein n=1 Tax=Schlesneria paludicola TaxID=360056 RepID=A0A7C2P2Q2_9PLAN
MANVADNSSASGTLVSWECGIGDDRKYHVAHVSPQGVTLVCKVADYKKHVEMVAAARNAPGEAAALLQQQPKAVHLEPGQLARVTYTKDLNQLCLFDRNQKKTSLPEGNEQADVFAAIRQHLGRAAREEEADAWSVMQGPLFILAVVGVIGGFFIWFTTICEPGYEATGRRAGMKQLLNWLGYSSGPVWMSVAVGSLAALVLAMMSYQLITRPLRQVLEYPGGGSQT